MGNTFVFISVILTALFLPTSSVFPVLYPIQAVESEKSPCPKGQFYKLDCNQCWCSPKDGSVVCTQFGCEHRYLQENCPKGRIYMEDCNSCICDTVTGRTTCTDTLCGRTARLLNLCPYGVIYFVDCNQCWCDPIDGVSACTRMNCFGGHAEDLA